MKTKDNNFKYDLYRFGDNIMSVAFENSNIITGVRNALFVTKLFTESSDVLLYRKNEKNEYDLCLNALMVKNNYKNDNNWINIFVNKIKHLFEDEPVKNIDCSGISEEHTLSLIPLTIEDSRYLIVFKDCNLYEEKEYQLFIKKFTRDMRIILDKLEQYNRMQEHSYRDDLTRLDNRNSYENDIKLLDEEADEYVYILLDLFRLKYVNDNYDYAHGDAYIVNTADILKKYFPKYYTFKDKHGLTIEAPTGSCVYRIGGDEYVVITKREVLSDIKIKLNNIREEVSNIDLNI